MANLSPLSWLGSSVGWSIIPICQGYQFNPWSGHLQREIQKTWNYLPEGGPGSTGFPLLGECYRNPSVSVYQLALFWEAASSFSEFFLKTLSTHSPISWWGIYEHTTAHLAECSAVFNQKWHNPYSLTSLLSWSHPSNFFFCFPDWKKSSKGNVLQMWKRWNKEWQKDQKASKSVSSKTVLSSGKKPSIGVLHQMGSTWKVTEV